MKNAMRSLPLVLIALVLVTLARRQPEAQANYTLTGDSWSSGSATWRANTNFPASAGTNAQVLQALQDSADAWTVQACSNFTFNYLGSTSGTSVSADGVNRVFYTSAPGSGTLATTTWWVVGGSNITDFDIRFWGDVAWQVNPVGGQFDIRGVATHEFGHALGLDHDDSNTAATMWATTGPGNNSISRRTLEQTDIDGVVFLYGADPSCGQAVLPSPNPMTFASPPSLVTSTVALMTATVATPGPVEYQFEYTGSSPGGSSSNWQTSNSFADTGLQPNTAYTYRCRARSALDTNLVTAWSSIESVATAAAAPGTVSVIDVGAFGFTIDDIDLGVNPAASNVAISVDGLYVDFLGGLSANPTWLPYVFWLGKPVVGLQADTAYNVRAKILGADGNETALGPAVGVTTTILDEDLAKGGISDGMGGLANVLTINGSDGGADRLVETPLSTPFSIEMAQPAGNPNGANWILWARFGIPTESLAYTLPDTIGTLCFTPCDVFAVPESATVGSTYGQLFCIPLLPAFPTPTTIYSEPTGLDFPVINFVMQGVCETSPGVLRTTNAIVFRNQN